MKNKVRIEQLEAQMEQLRKWVIEIDKEVFPKCTLEGNDAPPCTPLNDPSKTAIPVSIEDLYFLKNWFTGDGKDSEPIMSPSKFFEKYLP